MPVDVGDVLSLLSQLCDDANLRVTVKESVKSGLVAGGATTLGGILGGPVGVAVGGAIGVAAATYMAKGKFKSASQVLREMSPAQKQALCDKALDIVHRVGVEDMALIGKMAVGDIGLRQELLGTVVEFMSGQLKLEIVD